LRASRLIVCIRWQATELIMAVDLQHPAVYVGLRHGVRFACGSWQNPSQKRARFEEYSVRVLRLCYEYEGNSVSKLQIQVATYVFE
jgi:hypothetical protein